MPRDSVPGGGSPLRVLDAAVDLADDLGRLCQRPRERQAVRQHVVLPIATRRDRPGCPGRRCRRCEPTARSWRPAPTRRSRSCRGRGRSRSTHSAAWSRSGSRTPAATSLSAAMRTFVPMTSPRRSTSSRRSPSPCRTAAPVRAIVIAQPVVEPAVDLDFGDRARCRRSRR